MKAISSLMEAPAHPFCAIVGGSKVSSKIGVIKALIEKVDSIIIGGGMTYTFAAAQGGKVGGSICEPDMFPVALEILELLAKEEGRRTGDVARRAGRRRILGDATPRRPRPTTFPTAGRVWTSVRRAKSLPATTS